MQGEVIRGVPLAMKQDGWWLDDDPDKVVRRWRSKGGDGARLGLLVTLIALGDILVWQAMPGLSLAVYALAMAMAGLTVAWPQLAPRVRLAVASGAVLCVLPLVELLQPLSVFIALCGFSVITVFLAGIRSGDLMRASLRLWWVAPTQSARDGVRAIRSVGDIQPDKVDLQSLVMGWALPVAATLVFGLLLVGANPVIDRVIEQLSQWDLPAPNIARTWFWMVVGAAVWPVLVACRMRERLQYRAPQRATVQRPGLVNATSVARSLVAFNALFAMQTGLDLAFLYGSAALPEGISPAAYAHRGAYPLLVTALLAGLFAVLARPHLGQRPLVRGLMMLWLAQTMALVFASVWRLDLYIESYGLTPLRIAAYIWMGVVAVGLGIVAQQIWQDRPTQWMLKRCGALGVGVLYLCAFVSFDAATARYNLTRDVPEDREILCRLSEAVVPVIEAYTDQTARTYCRYQYDTPSVFQPADWREWGFRNWRVRRSLAKTRAEARQL